MLLSGIIWGNFFIVKIPRLAIILVRDFLTERGFIYCILFLWGIIIINMQISLTLRLKYAIM